PLFLNTLLLLPQPRNSSSTTLFRTADDHAHAVIDEEAGAQLRPRVDLNARQEPADVGDDPGQNVAPAAVEPVGDSVDLDGVEARIGQDDLPDALDGRVPLEDHLDVPLDPFKH